MAEQKPIQQDDAAREALAARFGSEEIASRIVDAPAPSDKRSSGQRRGGPRG